MNHWTTTPILSTSTTPLFDFGQDGFHFISPINITLAVYIILQNSMIIYHYHKNLRELVPFLFILIAAVDIGSAFSAMGKDTAALLCLRDESLRITPWFLVPCTMLSILCYVTSTFLGAVFAVVKTMKLMNPFSPLNECAVKLSVTIVPSIYLALAISDLGSWMSDPINTEHYKCDAKDKVSSSQIGSRRA